MNPSAKRIRELFALNDPNNYYWNNFQKFLQGHSYKARAALLSENEWSVDQERAMLAIISGVEPRQWFNTPAEQRPMLLLMRSHIRKELQRLDEPVNPMVAVRFKVLGACWDEVGSWGKLHAWNRWGSGVNALDGECKGFALNKMTLWQTHSPRDTELKIQALIGTVDELWGFLNNEELAALFEDYKNILTKEVTKMQHSPIVDVESVQTWRQLQGYPDFLEGVCHPHPWMESMCVAHTGFLVRDLPPAVVLRNKYGRTVGVQLDRIPSKNLSNPLDQPLAQALHRHFMGQDPCPEPEVQGLFALLEGSSGIVGTLMSMSTMARQDQFDVASDVFDYAP